MDNRSIRAPIRHPRVLSQSVDGTTVLLNLEDGRYFALNETAARVWELCDGTVPACAMVTRLAKEFDASEESIRGDVEGLIGRFRDEQLVDTAA